MNTMETEEIDHIIIGRVKPYIYAFETNTVPNFIKVGDTYRSVEIRLDEWRQYYENLCKLYEHIATVDDEKKVYFRDYSVHDYLIQHGFRRIQEEDIKPGIYLSSEFFKNATAENVEQAIQDIIKSYNEKDNRYKFYSSEECLPLGGFDYERNAEWEPRANQQEVIEKFKKAVKSGRKNLLMFAVMRFGKSFTSLCCAKEMGAKLTVVTCGRTAVSNEWKENVQRPKILDGFCFIDSDALKMDNSIISKKLEEGLSVVVFLTLQDLEDDEIKKRHEDLFKLNSDGKLDLLIIDETHFGARGEEYGKSIGEGNNKRKNKKITKKDPEKEGYDESIDELEKKIKVFSPKVKLHLSGTPYRILLENEFEREDIVGIVQYGDIIDQKEKWVRENMDADEWDNPYYGFPQMIRFAFNINESAKAMLSDLKKNGYSYDPDELFGTKSSKKSTNRKNKEYKYFKHEKEVLDLLYAIDGSKADPNIFAFLDYDKIIKGEMCHHIVMVLPSRASCDAMAELLKSKKDTFRRLKPSDGNNDGYEIINISGFDSCFQNQDYASKVKAKISECEREGKKTISLTVGKMLTGSTVREWDTMIYLRNTSSPQDYDQAIFRLQSPYTRTEKNKEGEAIIRDMKPQTLLVDFDPVRMFTLQHKKTLIANINNEERGNENLEAKLKRELEISPIIWVNANKLQQVKAKNIIDEIRSYNENKSVMDETFDIEVDSRLFEDEAIRAIIQKQPEMTDKGMKQFELLPYEDKEKETDFENPDLPPRQQEQKVKEKEDNNTDKEENLAGKLQGYYFKLLLFAFLSEKDEKTVSDIISHIKNDTAGKRIGRNLNIDVEDLALLREKINPAILSVLEDKINNINDLGKKMEPEKIGIALGKLSRLSSSEVVTPKNVADELVANLPEDISADSKILDIASKTGEFAAALLRGFGEGIKNNVYSIATSGVTYECTRKIYTLLGMPVEHIFSKFTSYDLIDKSRNEKILEEIKAMNFDAIMGNPPYQKEIENKKSRNGQKTRTNIFQHFENIAVEQAIKGSVLVFPAIRWIHQSGKGLKGFGHEIINDKRLDKLVFYPEARDLFENTEIDDGISIVVTRSMKKTETFCYEYRNKKNCEIMLLDFPKDELLILNPKDIGIVKKIKRFVQNNKLNYICNSIFSRTLFGIESDFIEKNANDARIYDDDDKVNFETEIKLLTNDKAGSAGRACWFVVNKDTIKQNQQYIGKWQVVVSSAHGGGQHGRDNQLAIIDNHSAFGRSKIALKSFDTENEAENFFKYTKSVFIRYAYLLSDEALSSLGKFVPDLLDYSDKQKLIDFSDDIDKQLRKLLEITDDEFAYIYSLIAKK